MGNIEMFCQLISKQSAWANIWRHVSSCVMDPIKREGGLLNCFTPLLGKTDLEVTRLHLRARWVTINIKLILEETERRNVAKLQMV